jgi:hypothetical protein
MDYGNGRWETPVEGCNSYVEALAWRGRVCPPQAIARAARLMDEEKVTINSALEK